MKWNGRHFLHLDFAALMAMTLLLPGCVSLQIPDPQGRPKIFGFGYTKSVGGSRGEIYEIVAPGLSLRTGSAAPGVSFGWHETRLFYPAATDGTNTATGPVAYQTKCIGLDLAPVHVMAGYESIFAIPFPGQGKHVVQIIAYSENNPTNTIVEQKEFK